MIMPENLFATAYNPLSYAPKYLTTITFVNPDSNQYVIVLIHNGNENFIN